MSADRTNAVFRDATSRRVVSAILDLHFADAATIADLTWGRGAFWDKERRRVIGLDVRPRCGCQVRADCRSVPLRDGAVDVAVFDPPHQHAPSKTTTLRHQDDFTRLPSQKVIHSLILDTALELRRVAKLGAVIKVTDMVESGRYVPTHALMTVALAPVLGYPTDLAILDSGVVRPVRPGQRVLHLRHAHSYFLVYRWGRGCRWPLATEWGWPQK